MGDLCFAYYCSGHGYGHATRVSALTCHLLKLDTPFTIRIHIISSAPKHVFADSVALGAIYRFAEIDPVIVQPLAYRVDRQKSVDALNDFLGKKQAKLENERKWLLDINANCVLSDAAFLGCLAAKAAGLPSILITNFTFDSVYSYLSTSFVDASSPSDNLNITPQHPHDFEHLVPDIPVPLDDLGPLVEQIHEGYRCADLLLLLPGCIPIPSFFSFPALPSQDWVDLQTNKFYPEITACLPRLSPSSRKPPSPVSSPHQQQHSLPQSVQLAPLLVRPPLTDSSVYTPAGRSKLLSFLGVPTDLHDPIHTKILVVSFGGQVFRRPSSRQPSRPASRMQSRSNSPDRTPESENLENDQRATNEPRPKNGCKQDNLSLACNTAMTSEVNLQQVSSLRLATQSHIWIPGAPPVYKPLSPTSPQNGAPPTFSMNLSAPTPPADYKGGYFEQMQMVDELPSLLPDASWIAIVCGVSKEQWNELDSDSELPDGFFVAPREVYMPDLTAVADVLLGKLGYGTVSECVDSCTPFVYVSRPLFIEEHGLRLLLDREGVGVELSRQSYESGDWAAAIEDAWVKGREVKWEKRRNAAVGLELESANEQGREMARKVVDWVREW